MWAAEHPRRERFAAGSTIIGNRLAPRIADRYLARTAVDAQQSDIPTASDRPDYLYAPLPGDRGTDGPLSDYAASHSPTWWATKRCGALAASVTVGGLAVLAASRRRGERGV